MINRIVALLAISTVASYGAANDLLIAQRNSTDTGQLTRLVAHPGGSQNGFVVYNGTSLLPQIVLLGDGLSWGSGQVDVTMSSAMASALATKQDTIAPATSADYYRGDKTWATFPSIPAAQVNSDWSSSSGLSQILNKPSLATVATSGAYVDLSGKPTIPSAQVQTDWNAVSGIGVLLNKPSLATVATSGSYSDLTGKPILATVATSGAYADLSGKPSIPSAQVNSDWNSASGLSQILNKPALATVAVSGSYTDLSNTPSAPSITNNPSRTIQTVASAANGWQVSSTKTSFVSYSVTITVNASGLLAGAGSGYVVLETATTNSSSAGSWVECARASNGQQITSLLTLASVQPVGSTIAAYIPAGNYLRLRSVNVQGTPAFAINSSQEVVIS